MLTSSALCSRRRFLAQLSAGAAVAGLPAWFLRERLEAQEPPGPARASDRPAIALIGCGGRGRGIAREAAAFGEIVAVCDVDARHAAAAADDFAGAKVYRDYRELLAQEKVQAILNGTPDHWHTPINIAALRAGCDVYSEKPLTLTLREGRQLTDVVREEKRVLQTGSQQRSEARFRLACELVRNGRLGKLQHIITSLPAGPNRGPFSPAPVPAELDWDFWQGPAPQREYVPERCHRSFRFWLEYSGGTLTDWGAHHNDIALWALGLDHSGPQSIEGKLLADPIPGGFTTPSEYQVDYTYANGVTHRCQSTAQKQGDGTTRGTERPDDLPNGVKLIGSDGWIFVTRGKIEASDEAILQEPLGDDAVRLPVSTNHMGNFFECMQSRRDAVCTAEIGHRAVSVCHLGVLALRLGRKLQWDPEKEQFIGDDDANTYLHREPRAPYGVS